MSTARRGWTACAISFSRGRSSCRRAAPTIRRRRRRFRAWQSARTPRFVPCSRQRVRGPFPTPSISSIGWRRQGSASPPSRRARTPRTCCARPASASVSRCWSTGWSPPSAAFRASPPRTSSSPPRQSSGSGRPNAAIAEDAVSGVRAGRAGDFALVLGVAREGTPRALREAGADSVVSSFDAVTIKGDSGRA